MKKYGVLLLTALMFGCCIQPKQQEGEWHWDKVIVRHPMVYSVAFEYQNGETRIYTACFSSEVYSLHDGDVIEVSHRVESRIEGKCLAIGSYRRIPPPIADTGFVYQPQSDPPKPGDCLIVTDIATVHKIPCGSGGYTTMKEKR